MQRLSGFFSRRAFAIRLQSRSKWRRSALIDRPLGDQAVFLRRRATKPIALRPASIIAYVSGSGTGAAIV
jgi:hypothetical protein